MGRENGHSDAQVQVGGTTEMIRLIIIIVVAIPFLLAPMAIQGQGQQEQYQQPGTPPGQPGQLGQPGVIVRDPFIPLDLAGAWKLYNETSGSTSIMKFNSDGTYIRSLHGNNLTGVWYSSIVTEQRVQLCPTEQKWTSQCELAGFMVVNPNSVIFLDRHGGRMQLMR